MLEGIEPYLGYLAGVTTALLWTGTSLFFTAAGRRLGTTVVNTLRIALAIVLLAATHRFLTGHWIPQALSGQVLYLALSGIIGLSIGDQALFAAFLDIGPRRAALVMTTSPLWAALFGGLVLGESLHGLAWVGMGLTMAGVAWVVLERPARSINQPASHRVRGTILALIGAACQAGGLLLSKQGIGHGWLPKEQHISPQTATLIRMAFAGVGMVPIVVVHAMSQRRKRRAGTLPKQIGSRSAGYVLTCCGAVVGPFLGVWMSLVASDRAPLGIAQTLCSLTPIFILPFAAIVHKDRITPRGVLGAFLAVGGSALLFIQAK